MKFLLSLMLLTVITQAQAKPQTVINTRDVLDEKLPNQVNALSRVDKIRSYDPSGSKVMVTFWETNQVFRIPKNDNVLPCLENSFKANQPVTLEVDQKSNIITECKLFGGVHPGMRPASTTGTGDSESAR